MADHFSLETAFLKAQKNMDHVSKDATNPFFKSKYATYDALINAVKKPLNDAGISFRHTSRVDGDRYFVGSQLIHAESAQTSPIFEMPIKVGNAQETGSALSYSRRYTLAALCGIASSEDDDGNSASQQAPPTQQQKIDQAERKPMSNLGSAGNKDYKITPKQQGLVFAVSKTKGWDIGEVGQYCGLRFGITDWRSMAKSMLDELLKVMEASSAADAIQALVLKDQPPPPGDSDIPF
jgi:hypothetical protein